MKFITLFSLCISVCFHACTVNYSLSGKSISPEVKTFSVAYIENQAPQIIPTLSDDITEGLKERFRSQAGLQLLSRDGDLQFEGKITDYSISYQGVTADQQAAQNRLTITVFIKYVNTIEPAKNFEKRFSASRDYDARGSGMEEMYIPEIVEQLIEEIFMNSVATW